MVWVPPMCHYLHVQPQVQGFSREISQHDSSWPDSQQCPVSKQLFPHQIIHTSRDCQESGQQVSIFPLAVRHLALDTAVEWNDFSAPLPWRTVLSKVSVPGWVSNSSWHVDDCLWLQSASNKAPSPAQAWCPCSGTRKRLPWAPHPREIPWTSGKQIPSLFTQCVDRPH